MSRYRSGRPILTKHGAEGLRLILRAGPAIGSKKELRRWKKAEEWISGHLSWFDRGPRAQKRKAKAKGLEP